MKIETGTYYSSDTPCFEWECQHCENAVKDEAYPNYITCKKTPPGKIGVRRCSSEACESLEVSEDALVLMTEIVESLKAAMEDKNPPVTERREG